MSVWEAVLIGGVLGIIALIWWYARRMEARAWNGGRCAESGRAWYCFDRDSQGGRCYADGAGHYCFISYRSVDHWVEP